MHAKFRSSRRGFTLVELMIVVAVIGILAALSLTGLRRYLTNAKAGEAKLIVGALSRAAHAAYQREQMQSQVVNEGVEKRSDGEEVVEDDGAPLTDDALREVWLRNVKTEPGDFLRAKFASQLGAREKAGGDE